MKQKQNNEDLARNLSQPASYWVRWLTSQNWFRIIYGSWKVIFQRLSIGEGYLLYVGDYAETGDSFPPGVCTGDMLTMTMEINLHWARSWLLGPDCPSARLPACRSLLSTCHKWNALKNRQTFFLFLLSESICPKCVHAFSSSSS